MRITVVPSPVTALAVTACAAAAKNVADRMSLMYNGKLKLIVSCAPPGTQGSRNRRNVHDSKGSF